MSLVDSSGVQSATKWKFVLVEMEEAAEGAFGQFFVFGDREAGEVPGFD